MKRLYIINMFYPYDDYGETFLASEIECCSTLEKASDIKKSIFPIWAKDTSQIKCEISDYNILPPRKYSLVNKIWWCFKALMDKAFWMDFHRLKKNKSLSLHNLIKSICFVGQGNFYAKQLVDDIISNASHGDEIILYSYWMHLQAYISVKASQILQSKFKLRSISRCHRFDVYEYVQDGFIPARDYIINGLDTIYPISVDAYTYLLEKYPMASADKIIVSRLGTKDKGTHISHKSDVLRIVSCSWMRPVKRNSLILDALKNADFPVEWTHIGDGEEFSLIENRISQLDNPYVKCKLLGRMLNDEVIDYYKNEEFDVFINVSASEGVPVSIMEAMSFGKIIVATDVGGTAEIVHDGLNGYLLPAEVDAEVLLETLRKLYQLDAANHDKLCKTSRKMWEELANEGTNYPVFWRELII